MPICELCGEAFEHITHSHLMTRHGITVGEYEVMFPESPLQSDDFIKSRINDYVPRDTDFRIAVSQGRLDWYQTKEGKAYRREQSKRMTEHNPMCN